MAHEWAWYSVHSFWTGIGYLMTLMVPAEVPVKMARPLWVMVMAVYITSSALISLRIYRESSNSGKSISSFTVYHL